MSDALSWLLAFLLTGGVLIMAGVLLLWLVRRSERGLLKRNPIAGVRTTLTLSSDNAWYPAQRAASPKTRVAAWGALIGGSAMVALGPWNLPFDTNTVIYMILALGSVGWLLGWVLAGAGDAQRAARDALTHAQSR